MEMTWRHLTYYSVKIAMKKYEANHILWAMHPSHQALWPAKVLRRVGKDSIEVQFFNERAQAKHVVTEAACKKFSEWNVDPKEEMIELYDAFLMARKERTRQAKTEEEECTVEEVGKEWGIVELKACINSLLIELPSEPALEKMKTALRDFKARNEDSRAYMSELLTQKLSYLLSQSDLNPSLRSHLQPIQRSLTELLCEQFLFGTL